MSQNTVSAITDSAGNLYPIDDVTKSAVSVDNQLTDVNMVHTSQADYTQKLIDGTLLSNELYVVSADYFDMFGEQIKNLSAGTDLSDAVNLEQLSEVSARAYDTYTKTETDQKIANAQYFKKYVVQTLPPVADADERGIYLVPSSDPETQNTYDEYVVVGEGAQKTWEKIGAKNIDLSGYKTKQTAKTSPTASSTATAFIDTISQDQNGVITATKKNVRSASTSLAGIVQLNDSTSSTSTSQAATANAVKTAYDAAVSAQNAANNCIPKTLSADTTLDCNTHAFIISCSNGNTVTYNRSELDGGYMLFQGTDNGIDFDTGTYNNFKNGSYIQLEPNAYIKSLNNDWSQYQTSGQNLQQALDTKSAVSVDNQLANINMVHISQADYAQKIIDETLLSNELYIISGDYIDAHYQQIKNLSAGTDIGDAVNLGQLNAISSKIDVLSNTFASVEQLREVSSECNEIDAELSGKICEISADIQHPLPYSFVQLVPTGSSALSVQLQDRSVNILSASSTATSITFTFPQKIQGKVRDLLLRLVITSTGDMPTLIFQEPDGTSVTFDSDDDAWAQIDAGVNLLIFTETAQ